MNKFYLKALAVGKFSIIILLLLATHLSFAQSGPRNGYSYVNITKQTVGGTVEPGDILEIRHSIHIQWGSNPNTNRYYALRYYDSVPSNTVMLTSPAEYLRVITNEGVTVSQYTTNESDDAGSYDPDADPDLGEYQVRINLGDNPGTPANNQISDATGGGNVYVPSNGADAGSTTASKPKWYSGHLFSTAFRVRVTGNYGDIIKLGAAIYYYSTRSGGPRLSGKVKRFQILIGRNSQLCSNVTGANFAAESGGTFGSGNTLVRSTVAESPIPDYRFIYNNELPNQPVNDGMYSIMKNTSPVSSTNINAYRELNCPGSAPAADRCDRRMFSSWDINGDHTGTNNATGNGPASASQNGGYMLVVNSDYVTNEAYRQVINGLCPNTTYEFSAWIRNVCQNCHWNANLARSAGDGVRPNLTWVIDDIDRYSTGEIAYTGTWVKKGFTFTTGMNQNSVTFSIRNNAQGGGGNDWVMDDIAISTCQPNLAMRPYGNAVVCYGNQVEFDAEVKSYFNNYTSWRWEKSTDGGTTWVNETTGTGTPVLVSGQYVYYVPHPPFIGDSAASGNIIRLRIATTSGNLDDDDCSFLATTNVVVMVNNCQWVLSSDITQFKAQPTNSGVSLRWSTVNEQDGLEYVVEKSTDGRNWSNVSKIVASGTAAENNYSSMDPGVLTKTTYYRISMVYDGRWKYTHHLTVQPTLEGMVPFEIRNMQNPFSNQLSFELSVPENGDLLISLYDLFGNPVKKLNWKAVKGNNKILLTETGILAAGTYIVTARFNDQITHKKLIKMNQR